VSSVPRKSQRSNSTSAAPSISTLSLSIHLSQPFVPDKLSLLIINDEEFCNFPLSILFIAHQMRART
jgi:hypothetical protein